MKQIRLLLVVHNHQPIGASHQRLEDTFWQCYQPFLDCFEEFESLRLSLHFSGGLLEWLGLHQLDYLAKLNHLVAAGRIEIVGGGFYDPILAWLAERDAVGQIRMTQAWVEERLGARPTGVWLAEQVWEPSLPRVLARAASTYTLVSARAFELGGYRRDPLLGYYITDAQGDSVAVFPIDERLSALLGDRSVARTMAQVGALAADPDGPARAVTCAVDGEGVDVDWFRELFHALSEQDVVELHPVGEFLDAAPSSGRVYLPSASRSKVFFSKFLVENPEANWMLQRAHRVSALLSRAMGGDKAVEMAGENPPDMLRSLWRATGYDAYVPPGMFSAELRHANYANLLRAEQAVEQRQRSRGDHLEHCWLDLDKDGHDEVEVTGQFITAYIKPASGGCLAELDYKTAHFNALNTLRPNIDGAGAFPRWSFVDHFLPEDATLEAFSTRAVEETLDVSQHAFRVVATDFSGTGEAGIIHLAGTLPYEPGWLELEKSYVFSRRAPALAVRYRITNISEHPAHVWFAAELNVNVVSDRGADNDALYLEIPNRRDPGIASQGELSEAGAIDFVSEILQVRLALRFDPALLWWHPLETFHEGGMKTFQGSCVTVGWKATLEPGERLQRTVRAAFSASAGSNPS